MYHNYMVVFWILYNWKDNKENLNEKAAKSLSVARNLR